MHTRDDYSCQRGYELWLIEQARARNPDIAIYSLAWTAPGWINNGTMYGPDTIEYMLNWLRCVNSRGGGGNSESDSTLGLWNEAAQPDQDYVVSLRNALDANGFKSTKISIMDNAYFNEQEVSWAQANSTYRDAIGTAGLHDPCSYAYKPFPIARELGWNLWSSEDFSRDVSTWDAQSYWGKALSQHYVVMNITTTISWSLIWSVYSNLICRDNGLMKARWPQSGYYEVSPTIWLHSHWGQFTEIGWRFLHVPGGGSGFLDVSGFPEHSGTYISLVPPEGKLGLTVIIETFAETSCMIRNLTDLMLTFTTTNGLPGPGTILYVWTSTQTELFVQQPSIIISPDSTFTVFLTPDSIMTVSTISTARKGNFSDSPIPSMQPWPLPYNDDFSTYKEDAMARYFSDQAGSWAVRNSSLQQVSFGPPIAWAPNGDPLSIAGSEDWIDYSVSATFVFSPKVSNNQYSKTILPSNGPVISRRRKYSQRKEILSTDVNVNVDGDTISSNSASVYVASCNPNDGSQMFTFTESGYIGSSYGAGGAGCLTTCGCDITCLQMWSCGVPGCSSMAYNWTLVKSHLLNSQYPGLALQANALTGTISLVNISNSSAQEWDFDSSTGLIRATSLGVCLSQLKPSQTYVLVCGRVSNYNGFNAATTPAYCTAVYASGEWALLVNSQPSLAGNITTFDPTKPHRVSISMAADIIEAYVDDILLGTITDNTYTQGNAAIGGGWHPIQVDDFNVTLPFF
jgi:hypothetical protein